MDIIENRYRMISEPELSGKRVSEVCMEFGVSRETWYKWKKRYEKKRKQVTIVENSGPNDKEQSKAIEGQDQMKVNIRQWNDWRIAEVNFTKPYLAR
jgi:transposase